MAFVTWPSSNSRLKRLSVLLKVIAVMFLLPIARGSEEEQNKAYLAVLQRLKSEGVLKALRPDSRGTTESLDSISNSMHLDSRGGPSDV